MTATKTYRGEWSRRNRVDAQVPLAPGPDPEHVTPTDNPEYAGMAPLWASTAPAPLLPAEMMPYAEPALPTGWGPVDHTPQSHDYGVGPGPGLTVLESQDKMRPWHNDDQGSVAATSWVPMVDRDGQPHADFVYGQQQSGDSPQTLQLERTGIGQPNDPGATARRRSTRLQRWYDRYYGNRTNNTTVTAGSFAVEYRPQANRNAYAAPVQPAVPNGNQLDSPWPTSPGLLTNPQDRLVAPQRRRVPGAWDESLTTDGTAATVAGVPNHYGLTTF